MVYAKLNCYGMVFNVFKLTVIVNSFLFSLFSFSSKTRLLLPSFTINSVDLHINLKLKNAIKIWNCIWCKYLSNANAQIFYNLRLTVVIYSTFLLLAEREMQRMNLMNSHHLDRRRELILFVLVCQYHQVLLSPTPFHSLSLSLCLSLSLPLLLSPSPHLYQLLFHHLPLHHHHQLACHRCLFMTTCRYPPMTLSLWVHPRTQWSWRIQKWAIVHFNDMFVLITR